LIAGFLPPNGCPRATSNISLSSEFIPCLLPDPAAGYLIHLFIQRTTMLKAFGRVTSGAKIIQIVRVKKHALPAAGYAMVKLKPFRGSADNAFMTVPGIHDLMT